jgi:GGDEF domain-containing protein
MVEPAGPDAMPADPVEATLADVLRSDRDGIVVLGDEGHVLFVNDHAATMFGQPAEDLVGGDLEMDINSGGDDGTAQVRIHAITWRGSPASLIRLHDLAPGNANALDAFSATHDFLSGLPNRFLLEDRIAQVLARAERGEPGVVLFYCALSLPDGPDTAERELWAENLLRAIGERLPRVVRPSDTVAYLGNGEFAILCDRMDELGTLHVAARLRGALGTAVDAAGVAGPVGLAMGSAAADDAFLDAEVLIEWAKKAAE